jgi:chemotaxis protein histidine kinase CheA
MSGRKHQPSARADKIAPGAYPTLSSADAMRLLCALRDPATTAKAARIIEDKAGEMREAVLAYIDRVDAAARSFDAAGIFEQAHEIRGLAGNAGLAATGRIANVLCKYLDALDRIGREPEHALVALHLDAIARAAHAEDEATRLGDTVANELAALVEKKLAEIKGSES